MSIYIYAKDANDFDNLGLCGALIPTECKTKERAGGMHELTLKHPIDEHGKWKYIESGCIIKAPVPVRTAPALDDAGYATRVIKGKVKATATKNDRAVWSKREEGKKRATLKTNQEITVVKNPADADRYSIRTGKTSGWVIKGAIDLLEQETIPATPDGIEDVAPAWSVRDQLFRLGEVERSGDGVTAKAKHISYDLLGNITLHETELTVTCQEALDGILNNCAEKHDFDAYTDIPNSRVGVHAARISPMKALLDPEEGVLARWGGELVRDDYDLYVLGRAGHNRGVRIEYGKNLLGVECNVTWDKLVTRILPVGQNKDGDPVYLSSDPDKVSKTITSASYVNSPYVNAYATPHILVIDVSEATIDSKKGGKDVTPKIACERMREAAADMFATGCDKPEMNMKVKFLNLGDTEEYAQFKELESVFLYDFVNVLHKPLGIQGDLKVVGTEFDSVTKRFTEIELGTLRDTIASFASWQIPTINGGKISLGSLGAGAFANEVISARLIQAGTIAAIHIAAETIEARHMSADSVTTKALAAGSVTADKAAVNFLIAQSFVAQIAQITQAIINQADIGNVHIDYANIVDLRAIYAAIASAEIGKADIGFAQIKDLVAGTAIIREGIGGQIYIDRLAVSEANMVSLTVGEMVIKGPDGHFYALVVDPETHAVTPVLKQVTGGDIANHTLNAGEKIIENSITANLLNVRQIFASDALIGAITAANINVGSLVAALIQSGFGATLDLSSNVAIRSMVNSDVVRQMIADSTKSLHVTYDGAGTHMTKETDTTTMTATIFAGDVDVTHTVSDRAFIWTRDSGNAAADATWNAAHIGMRQIEITKAEVNERSIISCTLLSAEDMALQFEIDPETMMLIVTNPPLGTDSASYDPATGMLTIDGEGYAYDQASQTIWTSTGLSATRTTVQYTFSDETGLRTRIEQTNNLIRLIVEDDGGVLTELRLTPAAMTAIARDINLNGRVSIGDLNPVAKALLDEIEAAAAAAAAIANTAETTAESALQSAADALTEAQAAYDDAVAANTTATAANGTAGAANTTAATALRDAAAALLSAQGAYDDAAAAMLAAQGASTAATAAQTAAAAAGTAASNAVLKADGAKTAADTAAAAAAIASAEALAAESAAALAKTIADTALADAQSAGSGASQALTALRAWATANNLTYINGSVLATGTVTADKIDVTNLYAWRLRDPMISTYSWMALTTQSTNEGIANAFGLELVRNSVRGGRLIVGQPSTGGSDQYELSLLVDSPALARGHGINMRVGATTHTVAIDGSMGAESYTTYRSIDLNVAPLSGGSSGIGAEAPVYPVLTLFRNAVSMTQNALLRGNLLYTGSLLSRSSRNVKEDIEPLVGHDLLMALDPMSYRYINGDDGKLHFGLIAEDVKKALKALGLLDAALYSEDNGENLSLAYTELIVPLVSGYQHQQRQIDRLQRENDDLKSRMEQLEQLMGGMN